MLEVYLLCLWERFASLFYGFQSEDVGFWLREHVFCRKEAEDKASSFQVFSGPLDLKSRFFNFK
jgi:hypothetical protein